MSFLGPRFSKNTSSNALIYDDGGEDLSPKSSLYHIKCKWNVRKTAISHPIVAYFEALQLPVTVKQKHSLLVTTMQNPNPTNKQYMTIKTIMMHLFALSCGVN